MSSGKTRYPRAVAIGVARVIIEALQPVCSRIVVAGSLRRRKDLVGDVEICFAGRRGLAPSGDLFLGDVTVDLAEQAIAALQAKGVIAPRPNVAGGFSWGPQNKLAVHCPSGVPLDLFATTERCWWNYLVCRTGNAENNVRIASAAQERGLKWHPTKHGFTTQDGEWIEVDCEQSVYRIAGLPYLEPWERN